eukprot:9419761-Alexandrium_andersonii.AAC.1
MQAAARHALGELAHGVSTGLVVWAGARCPACPACAPVLNCGEPARCPDCVCSAERCPRPAVEPSTGGWALL